MSELSIQPLTVAYVTRVARLLQSKFPSMDLDTSERWLSTMLGFATPAELYLIADLLRTGDTDDYARNHVVPVETTAEFQARQLAALAQISLAEAQKTISWLAIESVAGNADSADAMGAWKKVSVHAKSGDLDKAVATAIAAYERHPDALLSTMGQLVISRALDAPRPPARLLELLRIAGEKGDTEQHYNLANVMFDLAQSRDDYREALRCFEKAIAECRSPRMRAASLVNSTAIVRDGLASGEPDWEQAVERYERAARMGMVVAMFNAGNVSGWLGNQGKKEYVVRSAYWFQYAIDHVADGKLILDFNGADGENGLEATLRHCRTALAYMHVHGSLPDADPEYGIRLVTEMAFAGDEDAAHYYCEGMARRLMALPGPVSSSPAENWKKILTALNWTVIPEGGPHFPIGVEDRSVLREKLGVEVFGVRLTRQPAGSLAVVVTEDLYLPRDGGDDALIELTDVLVDVFPRGFILLTRRAMFVERAGRIFTRAFVALPQTPRLRDVSLSLLQGGSPESLLEQALRGSSCGSDDRYADSSCAISIAINTFDDGISPLKGGRLNSPWIGVGGKWRMPVVRRHNESADELLARVVERRRA